MSLTPRAGRRSRLLCADDVAEHIMMQPYRPAEFPRSRNVPYQPNESLYEGQYQHFSDDSETEQENHHPVPLTSSLRYNVLQAHSRSNPLAESVGPSSAEIITMMQEQQQLLHQVLEMQKRMQLKQAEFDSKLQELVKHSAESSSSSPDARGRKKFRIRRDLTRKVAAVHDNLEGGGFRQSEGSASTFDAAVKKKMIGEICCILNCPYTEEVKAAVQRKYESVRRQWKMEDRDGFDQINRQLSVMKKYRARRKRKFENRGVVVKQCEVKYWEKLTVDDMSEESDDLNDPNTLIVHKLQWCSQELCEFLSTLDVRYQEKTKKEGILVARKNGSPSKSLPRHDAPDWIIDPEWAQGSKVYASAGH